jgi:hypothetical protein
MISCYAVEMPAWLTPALAILGSDTCVRLCEAVPDRRPRARSYVDGLHNHGLGATSATPFLMKFVLVQLLPYEVLACLPEMYTADG